MEQQSRNGFREVVTMARHALATGHHRRPGANASECALVVESDDSAAREYVRRLSEAVSGTRVCRVKTLSDVADALSDSRVSAAVVGDVARNRDIVIGALEKAGARVCDVADQDCAALVEWRADVKDDGLVDAESRCTGFHGGDIVRHETARLNPSPGRGAVGFLLPCACITLTLTVALPTSLALRNIHAEVWRKDGERVALDLAGTRHAYTESDGLAVLSVVRPEPGLRYGIAWEHV